MHKSLSNIEVKNADKGEVSAVFSTFNVVDKDGDVTLPGAIADGTEVIISAYGHTSWEGRLPVGKGSIRTTDSEAILEGRFFLNTTAGRDTFEVVKELGAKQEWSYALQDVTAKRGQFEGQDVQFLERIGRIKEVSPVLVGAGVNTRTLGTKGLMSLQDQITAAMDVVGDVIEGAERVDALRAEQGKGLSQVNREGLDGLRGTCERLKTLLDTEAAPVAKESTQEDTPDDVRTIGLRRLFSNHNTTQEE